MFTAFSFGGRLLSACLIHGLLPFCFTNTGVLPSSARAIAKECAEWLRRKANFSLMRLRRVEDPEDDRDKVPTQRREMQWCFFA